MSETAEPGPAREPGDATEPEVGADHAWFRRLEEAVIALEGTPLMLTPSDWKVAKAWRREGMPLDLVVRTIEEVLERRAERRRAAGTAGDEEGRGKRRTMAALRYFDRPVRAAWEERRELTAAEARRSPATTDASAPTLDERLAALAAALPEEPSAPAAGRDVLGPRVLALAEAGRSDRVEEALAALQEEVLAAAWEELGEEERSRVEAEVARSLDRLGQRLDPERAEAARKRLRDERTRKLLGLPVLSLFSPEASEVDRGEHEARKAGGS